MLQCHVYVTCKYLLSANAFTGCDTTSSIHNFRRASIFKKLDDFFALANTEDVFYEEFKAPEEIGNACVYLFEMMYSPSDRLPQNRKRRYDDMVRTDHTKIELSLLTPSSRAAYDHGLRVHHQIKV